MERTTDNEFETTYASDKYGALMKKARIVKDDEEKKVLAAGHKFVMDFDLPWELANFEQSSGLVEVVYKQLGNEIEKF